MAAAIGSRTIALWLMAATIRLPHHCPLAYKLTCLQTGTPLKPSCKAASQYSGLI